MSKYLARFALGLVAVLAACTNATVGGDERRYSREQDPVDADPGDPGPGDTDIDAPEPEPLVPGTWYALGGPDGGAPVAMASGSTITYAATATTLYAATSYAGGWEVVANVPGDSGPVGALAVRGDVPIVKVGASSTFSILSYEDDAWRVLGTSDDMPDTRFFVSLLVAGSDLYVLRGEAEMSGSLFRFDDAYGTWTPTPLPGDSYYPIVAALPSGTLLACAYAGMFRSTNQGADWTPISADPAASCIGNIDVGPTALVGLATSGSYTVVYTSNDDGASWASAGLFSGSWSARFFQLADAVVAVDTYSVFVAPDVGGPWEQVPEDAEYFLPTATTRFGDSLLLSSDETLLSFDPTTATLTPFVAGFAATWVQNLFQVEGDVVAVSATSVDALGSSWRRLGGLPDPITISGAGRCGAATLAGAESGELFRLVDGASTWETIGAPTPASAMAFVQAAGKCFALGANDKVFRSDDGGATWSDLGGDFDNSPGWSTFIWSMVALGDVLIGAGAAGLDDGSTVYLFYRTLDESVWHFATDPSTGSHQGSLSTRSLIAIDGSAFVIGRSDCVGTCADTVWRTDSGMVWTETDGAPDLDGYGDAGDMLFAMDGQVLAYSRSQPTFWKFSDDMWSASALEVPRNTEVTALMRRDSGEIVAGTAGSGVVTLVPAE